MKEYVLYCINNGGKPFLLLPHETFEECYNQLLNIVNLEEERHRVYYVDNDFWNNKFPNNIQGSKYICLKEREVSEWKTYSKYGKKKNNIIYFPKTVDI